MANAIKMRRLYGLPEQLTRLQEAAADALDQVAKVPFMSGVAITSVFLTGSTTTSVLHGLGRDVQGWFITSIDAASIVNDDMANTAYDLSTTLPLVASADCTVDLWVW